MICLDLDENFFCFAFFRNISQGCTPKNSSGQILQNFMSSCSSKVLNPSSFVSMLILCLELYRLDFWTGLERLLKDCGIPHK